MNNKRLIGTLRLGATGSQMRCVVFDWTSSKLVWFIVLIICWR